MQHLHATRLKTILHHPPMPTGPSSLVLFPRKPIPPLPTVNRLIWLAAALACLSVLIVAANLSPSPTGMGTHLQLGLPPCSLLERSGVPCPSCGMTTAFSLAVRLQLAQSFRTQPAGAILAVSAALFFWIAFYTALTGIPVYKLVKLPPAWLTATLALSILLLAWAYKVLQTLS